MATVYPYPFWDRGLAIFAPGVGVVLGESQTRLMARGVVGGEKVVKIDNGRVFYSTATRLGGHTLVDHVSPRSHRTLV